LVTRPSKPLGHLKVTVETPDGQTKSGVVGYVLGKKNISEVIEEARKRINSEDEK